LFGKKEEDEDKKKQENDQNFNFFFKTVLFGHKLKKTSHSFFGAWSFLLIHI
jgi:hypothetical protein